MQHLLSRKHATSVLLLVAVLWWALHTTRPIRSPFATLKPLRSGPKFAVDFGIVIQRQTYRLKTNETGAAGALSKGFQMDAEVAKVAIPLSFSMKDVTVILLPYFFRACSSFDSFDQFHEKSTKKMLDWPNRTKHVQTLCLQICKIMQSIWSCYSCYSCYCMCAVWNVKLCTLSCFCSAKISVMSISWQFLEVSNFN